MATLGKGIELPAYDFRARDDENPHMIAYKRLEDESDAAAERGELVGQLIRFQVADGYAVYRVEKTKPLVLAHVDHLDGYSISDAHIRGLRVADVRNMADYAQRIRRLFASQGR